ncbi:MAG: AMIN domain-containing protein, partial [Deltaproteobacteria bacterium]|nr:AMIN domain-containing protein [Deltaproteobacteria bacterium]
MIKIMIRMIVAGLGLGLIVLSSSLAGQITAIKTGKEAKNEIEIIVEGEYGSYRAFGLPSPARFIIDLEGTQMKTDLPETLEIKGQVVSAIKTAQKDNSLRIVIESANSEEPFHSTIQDQKGALLIKCWMPVKAKPSPVTSSRAYQSEKALSPKDLKSLFGWPEDKVEHIEDLEDKKIDKYTGEKITLDFYKTDLHNVFRLFAEISGKNIIVDDEVKGDLTLALKDVPWDSALDFIMEVKDLRKEEKYNTFIIKVMSDDSKDDKEGELVVRKFSEEILQPARLLKREKENRQRARDMILEAHNLETKGNIEQALKVYEQSFDLQRNNIDLAKKMSYLYHVTGNFARSYYFAGEALKLNPKDAEAALYAALSAANMEKHEAAALLFKIATE